jgi:hypothetical protein
VLKHIQRRLEQRLEPRLRLPPEQLAKFFELFDESRVSTPAKDGAAVNTHLNRHLGVAEPAQQQFDRVELPLR